MKRENVNSIDTINATKLDKTVFKEVLEKFPEYKNSSEIYEYNGELYFKVGSVFVKYSMLKTANLNSFVFDEAFYNNLLDDEILTKTNVRRVHFSRDKGFLPEKSSKITLDEVLYQLIYINCDGITLKDGDSLVNVEDYDEYYFKTSFIDKTIDTVYFLFKPNYFVRFLDNIGKYKSDVFYILGKDELLSLTINDIPSSLSEGIIEVI